MSRQAEPLSRRREPTLGAFLGLKVKRGFTASGVRQAELEFYLWSHTRPFPFVQVITDMEKGGVAFYQTGTSASGEALIHSEIVCQKLAS